MTAKRKENGDLEVVKLGGQTITYRTALLLLVASITPVGDLVWEKFGISRDPVSVATRIEKQVATLRTDLKDVRNEVAELHSDVDTLSSRFTKFDVDFTKYQKSRP